MHALTVVIAALCFALLLSAIVGRLLCFVDDIDDGEDS
jgi:hypothetical protein